MEIRVIDRLFQRFEERGFSTENLDKLEWLKILEGIDLNLIKFGLNNLRGEMVKPEEFRKRCNIFWTPIKPIKDHKQWARDILKKAKSGVKLPPISITFAREALRLREDHD
jgi:hypothetical protein